MPLFSLVPSVGEPARFGFVAGDVPVYLDTSVRTGSDYGVTVTVPDITELTGFISSRVTFWGVPGDPRHDASRGWNCLTPIEGSPPCLPLGEASPPPLLSMPTACDGPVRTGLEADSWQNRGVFPAPFEYTLQDGLGRTFEMDGCNRLPFAPSIGVAPDGQAASTPTGLSVKIHVSQESQLNSEGLAEGEVRDTTVALPEGVALNPAAADGLQACSEAQIGYLPSESSPGKLRFTAGPALAVLSGILEGGHGRDQDAAASQSADGRGVSGSTEPESLRFAVRALHRRARPRLGNACEAPR